MADISPELAAKINDLEDRHDENPGRYFVALSSALREAGEVGRAEELLRSGLKRHSGSLSAHIVLGRCLADRGAVEEATNEFRYVLSVDPQNLIALRTLGEMSAAGGRSDEAARWYRELLAVDPMNKEAREALDALASAPPPRAQPSPDEAFATDGFGGGEYGMVELSATDDLSVAPQGGDSGMVEPADAGLEIRGFDDDRTLAFGAAGADAYGLELPAGESAAGADSFAADLPPELPGDAPGEFGLVELEPSSGSFGGDLAAAGDNPPAEFGAWGEISLEPSAAAASPVDESPERPGEYDTFSFGDVPLGSGAAAGGDLAEDASVPMLDFGAADELAGAGEDDVEVVTETMAELYARQGFHDRAAEVYRELIRRRGEEPGLVARLAEVEGLARGEEPAPAAEPWHTVDDELRPPPSHEEPAEGALPLLETGLPGLGLPILPDQPSYEPEPAAFDAAASLDLDTAASFDLDDEPAFGSAGSFDTPASFGAAGSFDPTPSFEEPASLDAVGAFDEPMQFDTPTPYEAAQGEEPVPATAGAGPALTGDTFADSFAWGFAGSPAGAGAPVVPSGDSAAAVIEATADSAVGDAGQPAPELISGIVDQPYGADTVGASHADDPLPLPGTTATPSAAAPAWASSDDASDDFASGADSAAHEPVVITDDGEIELQPIPVAAAAAAPAAGALGTVADYLSSLLAWRPGMGVAAPAAAFPAADAAPADDLSAAAVLDAPVGAEEPAPSFDPEASADAWGDDAGAAGGFDAGQASADFAAVEPSGDPSFADPVANLPFDPDPADEALPFHVAPGTEGAEGAGFDAYPAEPTGSLDAVGTVDGTDAADAAPSFELPAADEPLPFAAAPAEEPVAEPWAAFDAAATGQEPAAEEPAAGEDDADLPWISAVEAEPATASVEEQAPWDTPWETPAAPAAPAADTGEVADIADFGGFQIEELPGAEAAPQGEAAPAAGSDGLYPWEFGSDAAPPAAGPAAEPEAPAAPAGGFSFEDFFAEPAAPAPGSASAPAPAPIPVPAPAPEPLAAEAPGAPAGGDDDEDLESFQAWLQSLKR